MSTKLRRKCLKVAGGSGFCKRRITSPENKKEKNNEDIKNQPVAGALGHWVESFGIWIYEGGEFLTWFVSGLGSGPAFVMVGLNIAPETTEHIKWVLAILLLVIGAIAAVGPILAGESPVTSIAGAVTALVAIGAMRSPVDSLSY